MNVTRLGLGCAQLGGLYDPMAEASGRHAYSMARRRNVAICCGANPDGRALLEPRERSRIGLGIA